MTASSDGVALGQAYAASHVKPTEVVDEAIAVISRLNPTLNAIIHPSLDEAAETAAQLDDQLDGDLDRQPAAVGSALWGAPIAVKDLGAQQAGKPHQRGSAMLRDVDWRAKSSSYLWQRLEAAGVVCVGRTNTPEFGSTITTEPVAFGATANPWSPAHTAGGSSGGSAAAVAAGLVVAAHGNDGGGSLRIPAAACGLVGLKPTRGRVSTGPHRGEHRGALAVDGVLTRSVRDAAAYLSAIAGPYAGDWVPTTSWQAPSAPADSAGNRRPASLRVAVATHTATREVAQVVEQAAATLSQLGHMVGEAKPDGWFDDELRDRLVVLRTVSMAAELDEWAQRLGREVTENDVEPANFYAATVGRSLAASTYVEAVDWLARWRHQVMGFWRWPSDTAVLREVTLGRAASWAAPDGRDGRFDLLLTPVLADVTPELGFLSDPRQGQQRLGQLLGFVDQANATGQPAVSLPLGVDSRGLPVGVQLIGAHGTEALLLAVGEQLTEAGALVPCEPAVRAVPIW